VMATMISFGSKSEATWRTTSTHSEMGISRRDAFGEQLLPQEAHARLQRRVTSRNR
jgi:hypothetical protein